MNALNERIRNLRLKQNWSQEELAEKMSVSRQSVSKWENGDAQPDLDKIVQLGDLFDVSLDYLLAGKENSKNVHEIAEDSKNNEQHLNEHLHELRRIYGLAAMVIYVGGSMIFWPLWSNLWVVFMVFIAGCLIYELHKNWLIKKMRKDTDHQS